MMKKSNQVRNRRSIALAGVASVCCLVLWVGCGRDRQEEIETTADPDIQALPVESPIAPDPDPAIRPTVETEFQFTPIDDDVAEEELDDLSEVSPREWSPEPAPVNWETELLATVPEDIRAFHVGQTYLGFEVRQVDPVVGTVWFVKGDESIVLGGFSDSHSEEVAYTSPPGEEWLDDEENWIEDDQYWIEGTTLRPEYGDFSLHVEREVFEPLDFEIERGIDPHDVTTWPPDYQGPGIERALRGIVTSDE